MQYHFEKILDILKKHQVPAAFFLVGNYMEKNADLVSIGAYKPGSNRKLDHALTKMDEINGFLKQDVNEAFTYEIERRQASDGPNIKGFGVINLKDTMPPNSLIRVMARKRTEKNKAIVLTDDNRNLARAWGLGDCNNCFALLVVNKQGELVYCNKGELTEKEQEEFFQFIAAYK